MTFSSSKVIFLKFGKGSIDWIAVVNIFYFFLFNNIWKYTLYYYSNHSTPSTNKNLTFLSKFFEQISIYLYIHPYIHIYNIYICQVKTIEDLKSSHVVIYNNVSIYIYVYIYIIQSINLFSCLSICFFACISVFLPINLFSCLSICFLACISVFLPIYLFSCLYICFLANLCVVLPIYLFSCLFCFLSLYFFVW